jgi:hypothetical protein
MCEIDILPVIQKDILLEKFGQQRGRLNHSKSMLSALNMAKGGAGFICVSILCWPLFLLL